MKLLIAACLWIAVVTLASVYIGATWRSTPAGNGTLVKPAATLERRKLPPLNVPMIANGSVQGYIVAALIYLADSNALRDLSIPPDDYLADEAFRLLYASEVDFEHLQKYDLQSLTATLAQKVNTRLGGEIIKEVLVEEFTYVPKRELSR